MTDVAEPLDDPTPVRRRSAASLTPAERSLRARLASHASWAKTPDPSARTAAARSKFLDRFERQVDPDGDLDPADRARRAEHARKAYMQSLALKSARARRAKARAARQKTHRGVDHR